MRPEVTEAALKAYLSSEREKVDRALDSAVEEVLPMIPGPFRAAVRHGVSGGGKRLRPILCATAYRAGGGTRPEVYTLCASLEMIHAYSLMHDDLPCMDDAVLRRGETTTHKACGEYETTIAGALLIPAASLTAYQGALGMGLDEPLARELVTELVTAAGAGGMVGGQVLDLLGEDRALPLDELSDLHRRKTGALLRASLRMGGKAARISHANLEGLDRYGVCIGLAFQIADDVLDATSTAQELGKNPSDADLGKSTYVGFFGIEKARERAQSLVAEAQEALRASHIESPQLDALARYIVERKR